MIENESELGNSPLSESTQQKNISIGLELLAKKVLELLEPNSIEESFWNHLGWVKRWKLDKSVCNNIKNAEHITEPMNELSDTSEKITERLTGFLARQGVIVSYAPIKERANWNSHSRVITVNDKYKGKERAALLTHETGHFISGHYSNNLFTKFGEMYGKEVVAESISFIVMYNFGIYRKFSFPYIAGYLHEQNIFERATYPELLKWGLAFVSERASQLIDIVNEK